MNLNGRDLLVAATIVLTSLIITTGLVLFNNYKYTSDSHMSSKGLQQCVIPRANKNITDIVWMKECPVSPKPKYRYD